MAYDSFALVTRNNSFSSEAAGNFAVMKDLAFGAATFRDPTAGFGSALICVFLHFHLSLATTKKCNNIFSPFVCRPVRGWPEALGISTLDIFANLDFIQSVIKTFLAVPSSEIYSDFSFRY